MRARKNTKRRDRVLIAMRTLTINGKRYPCGSILAMDLPAKSRKAMVDGKPASAAWQVHDDKFYPRAKELPPSEPPKPRPAVQLVDDPSAETAWHLTKAAMTRCCDGNAALAQD